MKAVPSILRATCLAAGLAAGAILAAGSDDPQAEIQALREQIRILDKRLEELERKEQQKEKASAVAARSAPKVELTDRGFALVSGDGANAIRFRGLVQVDSRLFFDNGGGASRNSLLLRRARPILEGTLGGITSFQFVPEFGGTGSPSILDANLGLSLGKAVQLKFGKFKAPVGLEQLASDSYTFFNERSLVTNLVPNRDIGAQIGGSAAGGAVTYAAGVFNGVADGASSTNADVDNDKDVVGRLILQPFRNDAGSPLRGLAFGAAGSAGRGKTASPVTAGYKTDGQQTFFRYRSSVVADGPSWRLSPQVEYRQGPFGAIGEYVVSAVSLRSAAGTPGVELRNRAWQIAAAYVLTGEDSSSNGVVPAHPFDWKTGAWGAWEVAARYARLTVDDQAFPLFADPATAANEAGAFGVGVSWYLTRAVRTTFDYYQTHFTTPVARSSASILRQDEQTLITRVQLSF